MSWKGIFAVSALALPAMAFPYAMRAKLTISPSSVPVSIRAKSPKLFHAPTKVIIIPPPVYSPPPCIIGPPVVWNAPVVAHPPIYPVPMPVHSPSFSSPSTSVADLLLMQALLKLDKEVEGLREEVENLRDQLEAPRCPTCGRPMEPEWNICPYDGTRLPKGLEEKPAPPKLKPTPRVEEILEEKEFAPPAEVDEVPVVPDPEKVEPEVVPKEVERAAEPLQGWVVDWDKNLMRAVGRASFQEGRGDPERTRMLAHERAYDALRKGLLDLWGKRQQEGVNPYQWAAELSNRAKVIRERELPDGTWEVEVELKFGKQEEKPSPQPAVTEEKEEIPLTVAAPSAERAVEERAKPPKEPEAVKPAPRKGPFTGLIVDARGLGLKPAMSPKIWDENGRLVWQKVEVSHEFAIKHGIVAYVRSMEEALKNPRAGKNPLIVKAKGLKGPFKADPVLSPEDADLVIKENKETKFLEKCKVVFIIY